jgi:ankyrin repeat protein
MNRYVAVLEPLTMFNHDLDLVLQKSVQENNSRVFLTTLTAENYHTKLNEKGEYPIHLACMFPEDSLALLTLLHLGANPNEQTLSGETPLHYCVAKGNIVGIRSLLSLPERTNPYLLDSEGRSPLRLACEMMGSQRPDGMLVVKTLLNYGLMHASVNRHNDTLTIAFFAYMNGSEDALQLIEEYILYPNIDHIHPLRVMDFCNVAVLKKHIEQVGEITFLNKLIPFSTEQQQTVFHHVTGSRYIAGLEIILDLCRQHRFSYEDVLNQRDIYGYSPVDYAAEIDNAAILSTLISAGAAIDIDLLTTTLQSGSFSAFKVLFPRLVLTTDETESWCLAARSEWLRQVRLLRESLPQFPSLTALFPENPQCFNTTKIIVALNKLGFSEAQKSNLRQSRDVLIGIKKILDYTHSKIHSPQG